MLSERSNHLFSTELNVIILLLYGFSSTSSHVFLDFAVLLLVPSILAYYSRIYCRYGCPGYAGDVLHFWNMISALPRVLAASEGHKHKAK